MTTHPVEKQGFRELLDAAADAMLVVDARGNVVALNPEAERLFRWTEAELQGESLNRVIPPRFQPLTESQLSSDGTSPGIPPPGAPVSLFARRRDGTEFPVEFNRSPLGPGRDALVLVTIRDLTKWRRAQETLFREKEQAFVTLASIADAVITTDLAGTITYLNPPAERLTGWRTTEALGQPLGTVLTLISEATRQPIESIPARCLREGRAVDLADGVLLLRRDGSEVAIGDSAAPLRDRNGATIGVVLVFHDVTERRRAARTLSHQATHDSLTGLISRQEFERRLARVLAEVAAGAAEHALCYVDLDRFKVVNDTCGHARASAMRVPPVTRSVPWPSGLLVLLAACGGDSTGPVVPLEFAAVRTAFFRTCGLTTAGAVYCWGIQDLTAEPDSIIYTTPRRARGTSGLEFAALDIAGNYTCGITVAGAAYCWSGKYGNFAGALGIGSMDTSAHPTPRAVVGGLVFAAVTTGGTHTCGLTTDGNVFCWGNNEIGQLGDGSTTPRSAPVLVLGGHTFRAVSAGAVTTCALTSADDAYCWGSGLQLGNGTTTHDPGSSTPVPVSGGHKFTSLSVGESATCAVTTGGAGYCWGRYDNLGGGAMTTSSTPAAVAAGITLATISVSPFHTCGVATNAAAYCWGYNDNGQLGNGTMTGTLTPQLVSGGLSFASVDARGFHTCGITTDPLAYCWGSGYVGVLGEGSRTDRTTPVRVSGQ